MPPMMVAPLRLVPGTMARHCTRPTFSASSGPMSSTLWMRTAVCWRRSAHRMTKPPRMKVLATTTGVNRCSLMALPNSRPSSTAGRKPISTFSVKRCAWRWLGSATSVSRMRCQYTRMTAKMAPVWMAMSKTLALASSKPSSEPARIRWPVDEIGRNSVSPSTTPMTAALSSKTVSTRVLVSFSPSEKKRGLSAAPRALAAGPPAVRAAPGAFHAAQPPAVARRWPA